MSIAAVPAYLGKDFNSAPPGHRFTLYLEAWRDDFTLDKNNKTQAVKCALPLPDAGKALEALRARQLALADALKAETFRATAIAPFATGLGMEHPLENGFAFLNPYGLPYLPGSGVKGVLRAAARELCPESEGGKFDSDAGWTQDKVRALFGGDPGKEPFSRGALTFWDVIPTVPINEKTGKHEMRVDVMTPHHKTYYEGKSSPHDSGNPEPHSFLTVPPGAEFRFIVTCEEKYLKDGPLQNGAWKVLLKAAFMHAYKWLGFGAKTAVGYGAMLHQEPRDEELEKAKAWLAESIARICKETNAPRNDVIGGRRLAEEWSALSDGAIKGRALQLIRAAWEELNWWHAPPGKAKRQAKAIYEGQS
jgi:CRISPR-associated protein Cmr6